MTTQSILLYRLSINEQQRLKADDEPGATYAFYLLEKLSGLFHQDQEPQQSLERERAFDQRKYHFMSR